MDNIIKANSILIAASISLIFFAILNIAKESNDFVKNLLNFYPPTGPLLGLFLSSILIFIFIYFLAFLLKPTNQKAAFFFILISSFVFFLLVFPPVFEPIVDLFKIK
jgi:hypothetical protein